MSTVITLLLSPKVVLQLLTSLLPKNPNKSNPKKPLENRQDVALHSLLNLKTCTFSLWNLHIFSAYSFFDIKVPSMLEDSGGG